MKLSLEEIMESWQDVLDTAEPGDYEIKNLVTEFLADLHALDLGGDECL